MENFQDKTLLNQLHVQLDPYCKLPDILLFLSFWVPVCLCTIKLFPSFFLSWHHWHEIVYQVPPFRYCKQWKLGGSLDKLPSNFC